MQTKATWQFGGRHPRGHSCTVRLATAATIVRNFHMMVRSHRTLNNGPKVKVAPSNSHNNCAAFSHNRPKVAQSTTMHPATAAMIMWNFHHCTAGKVARQHNNTQQTSKLQRLCGISTPAGKVMQQHNNTVQPKVTQQHNNTQQNSNGNSRNNYAEFSHGE